MSCAALEPSSPVVIAEEGLAGLVASVIVGIVLYAGGSFLLMRRHVGKRAAGASFRAFAHELWIAAWTQPLLPLFYFVGYNMGRFAGRRPKETGAASTPSVPVVFVHGYMQNRVGFLGLARALGRAGFGPLFGFNYPWFASIASNSERLDRFLAHVCEKTGSGAVDLVCHSMGGLVALEMMRNEALRATLKVRRCVTIASPHAGVLWRGPLIGVGAGSLRRGSRFLEAHAGVKLAVPCLSVYSTHDNLVHPKESSSLALRGGRDVEVEGPAHLAILFTPEVAEHVVKFLGEPGLAPAEVLGPPVPPDAASPPSPASDAATASPV